MNVNGTQTIYIYIYTRMWYHLAQHMTIFKFSFSSLSLQYVYCLAIYRNGGGVKALNTIRLSDVFA